MYQHHNWQGALLDYPVSKVVCVGSNYAKHIKEMGSAVPEEPVLFIKPETALCDLRQPLAIPSDFGSVHHEVELAVLIGATLRQATEEHVRKQAAAPVFPGGRHWHGRSEHRPVADLGRHQFLRRR